MKRMPFRPLGLYLAELNPAPMRRRRRLDPSPVQVLLAIAIVALAVGWLPQWLINRIPP